MTVKQLILLIAALCSVILNPAWAEASESAELCTISSIELRKMKIKSGSLEETAFKDGWKLELLDTARDLDYMTDTEKDIILTLNMVRTDPCRYAELYVRPIIGSFNGILRSRSGGFVRTSEGRTAAVELYKHLIQRVPEPILVSSPGLHRAADELALDQSMTGKTGHSSSKSRDFDVRIRSCGKWKKAIAETIDYVGMTGFDMVNNLLIDDGISNRAHRVIMLNPLFHFIGISVRPHNVYGYMAVMDYAGSFAEN
jgi:hypothetical protein